ncbi:site-2 protease family protein [Actinomycetospora sp. C-140]
MTAPGTADAGAVRLGRVAGIPVAAHWSVAGIVVLIALVVARSELPLLTPGHTGVAYAAGGLAVALLLLLSLLAHEMAHALVARRAGLEVEGITLWLLGGTTRMRGEPERPGVELRVAVVGPLVSAGLAGLFACGALLGRASAGDLVVAVLAELAVINLALAVFNILPAAPLDGGRVLRAALWASRGDRWQAAIAAARVGQALAVLLVAGGVLLAFLVDLGGLWVAVVGWFIAAAAGEEERRARQGRALDGVPVSAAAAPAPRVLAADAPADELAAAALSPSAAVGGLLLLDADGRPSGYLPPELLGTVAARAGSPSARRHFAVPASRLTTVPPDAPLGRSVGALADRDARLVLLDGDRPVGTVSRAEVEDVLRDAGVIPPRPAPRSGRAGDTRPAGVPSPDEPPPPGWWWTGGPGSSGASSPRPAP